MTNLIDNKFSKNHHGNCHILSWQYSNTNEFKHFASHFGQKGAQIRYWALRSLASFAAYGWRDAVGALLSDKVKTVLIAAADLYITIPRKHISGQYAAAFSLAQKELEKSLVYQTDFSTGNVMLADYYLILQDYENAEKFYMRGLKKDSKMSYALLNLSVVYNIQEKNKQALQALDAAIKNDPNNERIYYNMALLHNEMNAIPAAEKSFANAVELKSSNPKVYYNYGLILKQNNKFKEAEYVLLKGININPSDSELYYALTFVYIQMNNRSKAQQTAIKLKQLDPGNPTYQQIFKTLEFYSANFMKQHCGLVVYPIKCFMFGVLFF